MFSFLRRGTGWRKLEPQNEPLSPFTGSPEASRHRAVPVNLDEPDPEDDLDDHSFAHRPRGRRPTSYFERGHQDAYDEHEEEPDDDDDDDDEGEDPVRTPLLPIFSAAHLDRLPLYNITHAIRLLIVQRCETTLSWEQLRSPQISQFLVKPIQSQIRSNQFNRATICALVANCLQFSKEGQLNPGNVGVSKTRALISELLAMRLLKEFTTLELIDALSYDFDPLQGMSSNTPTNNGQRTSGWNTPAAQQDLQGQRTRAKGARVSTIEIAIRAQAKRFLAHPVVVEHLQAIWAGTVVFHSEADNLHRKRAWHEERNHQRGGHGTFTAHSPSQLPADVVLGRKAAHSRVNKKPVDRPLVRRSVTLYDPRDASLFKLSRLRVPRYRQLFTTLSFATMLILFIAVLAERSLDITPLEVLFWIWSAAYMLDEVVGFTEQGFGLYILSFWNAFDLGILMLFMVYYFLRLYGIVLADSGKYRIANAAYDVLGSTAILLFPRLFSVLDHYRYFSQLLIAFRMMAQDLAAILVLIVISCSGFFVAFLFSFSDETMSGNDVAYTLFQILMGFSPAAWDKWLVYNFLGKVVMTIFLVIGHFLIVTILITVLTNSFMAIVQNAHEEHQFLFAVNTISMVKSDALFSYIAPTNVLGWVLSPLRYIMPFRQYVKLNRTLIKLTHIPILFAVFVYEQLYLSRIAYQPGDLIEQQASPSDNHRGFMGITKAQDLFSPGRRLREPSVVSFHKDRALDEVFRRPFKGSTVRTTTREMGMERRNSTNVVDSWMQIAENEGGASPPMEQPRSVLERLEHRRPLIKRGATADKSRMGKRGRDFSSLADDVDVTSTLKSRRPHRIDEEEENVLLADETLPQDTEADGDEEENGDSEPGLGESISIMDHNNENATPHQDSDTGEYFHTPPAGKSPRRLLPGAGLPRSRGSPDVLPTSSTSFPAKALANRRHQRQTSTSTTLLAPQQSPSVSSSTTPHQPRPHHKPLIKPLHASGTTTPRTARPAPDGTRTPRGRPPGGPNPRPRPIMPPRQQTAPNLAFTGFSPFHQPGSVPNNHPPINRTPSFNALALDLASEIGDNKFIPTGTAGAHHPSGLFPASFNEQMLRERDFHRRMGEERAKREREEEEGRVGRILMARMVVLEEGLREVVGVVRGLGEAGSGGSGLSAAVAGRRSPKKGKSEAKTRKGGSGGGGRVSPPVAGGKAKAEAVGEGARPRERDTDGGARRPATALRSDELEVERNSA